MKKVDVIGMMVPGWKAARPLAIPAMACSRTP